MERRNAFELQKRLIGSSYPVQLGFGAFLVVDG